MNSRINAKLAINSRDVIGEGPAWDGAGNRFLWTDNAVGVVHEARLDARGDWAESRRWNLDRRSRAKSSIYFGSKPSPQDTPRPPFGASVFS